MGFLPNQLPEERPGVVDYRFQRARVLSEVTAGTLARHEVCDAHPELRRAGIHVGTPTGEDCPVCAETELRNVTYVFGPRLPAHGRCVTSAREMERLRARKSDYTAYIVEICPACGWNHLVRSFGI